MAVRLFAVVCVLLAGAASASAQGSSPVRMAYFSPARVFAESSAGKALAARIEVVESERARTLQERTDRIAEMERTLQQGAAVLSESARGLRVKELEKFRLDTQRFIQDTQAELTGVRRDAESAFLLKLTPAAEQVIKVNGIQLMFNGDSGVLWWADPQLDLTDQVVKAVDGGK
jgi:outer membrane protein